MEAEFAPGLSADDLLPGRFVKEKSLQGSRIEDYDLVNVAVLQDLHALGADRVARQSSDFGMRPFQKIVGDVFRLEHSCHHMSEYVSVIDKEHISNRLFADVSLGREKTKSTVLSDGGKKSYVVLHEPLRQHEAGLHIMAVEVKITAHLLVFVSRAFCTLLEIFDGFSSFGKHAKISVCEAEKQASENDERKRSEKHEPAVYSLFGFKSIYIGF